MAKDTFYFPHDNNARNDDRVLTIRAEFENEKGYAWYFWILESMAETTDGRLMRGALPGLELGLNVPAGSLKPFIERCIILGLFEANETHFWSPRMIRQKQVRAAIIDGAKRGGEARWKGLAQGNAGGNAQGNAKERKGKERKDNTALNERFAAFWAVYPKKVAKDAAEKAFRGKVGMDDAIFEQVLRAVKAQRETLPAWVSGDKTYIPNPASWLNAGRWKDEISTVTRGSNIPEFERKAAQELGRKLAGTKSQS